MARADETTSSTRARPGQPVILRMKCCDAKTSVFNAVSGGLILLALPLALLSACDGGIAPPETTRVGTISGTVTYSSPWPPEDQFQEIRFVALRFVPRDTADFLQLNRISFSDPLTYGLAADSFVVADVPVGFFPYSGIARQETDDIFSWGPIGLYQESDGVFNVVEGETTFVSVVVDFTSPPDFPTPALGYDR